MKPLRALSVALLAAGLFATASAQVRPEVGKPLQQAGELLKAGKAREALAKVREADAVGGKTAAEQTMIERMRAAAAQRAGDTNTAIQATSRRRSPSRSPLPTRRPRTGARAASGLTRRSSWAPRARS